jgi:hypothetical protein
MKPSSSGPSPSRPPAAVGVPYRVVLDASACLPPYRYEPTGLPDGLTFEEDR